MKMPKLKKAFTPLKTGHRRRPTAAYGSLSLTGFTLIEVLIATAILSLITGAIMAVLMVGLSSWQIGEAKTQGQQDTRRAMQNMTRELRLSNAGHIEILNEYNSVISTGTGVKIRFQVPMYNKVTQQIDLDVSGNKKWGADTTQYAWVCYQLVKEDGQTTGQLKRTILSSNKITEDSSTILADNVQTLNFIGLPNNTYTPTSIQVILVTTNIGNKRNINSTLKSRVWLRNLS